jgi:hypothetical protein
MKTTHESITGDSRGRSTVTTRSCHCFQRRIGRSRSDLRGDRRTQSGAGKAKGG